MIFSVEKIYEIKSNSYNSTTSLSIMPSTVLFLSTMCVEMLEFSESCIQLHEVMCTVYRYEGNFIFSNSITALYVISVE